MTEWIRAVHAQAEKEAAVAAEREAWASYVAQENIFANDVAWYVEDLARDIRAARDARVRADALREAAVNLRTYAPHLEDGPEHDVGYYHGYQTALDRILALIPADQEEKSDD